MIRFIAWVICKILFRHRAEGHENLPTTGPFLLAVNIRKIAFEWGKGTGHGPHAGGYGFCLDAQAMDSLCRGRAKA